MSQKPPPIKVSAQGIEAKPVTMNDPVPVIDWRALAALPPFQMFVHERSPCPPDADSERWTIQYVERFVREVDAETLLEKYARWHADKGYWPDEDCMGNTKMNGGDHAA
jgi:hypothetical protein